MQDKKTVEACKQAKQLCELHNALQEVYGRLADLEESWNPEFDEYLREERYLGRTGRQYIKDLAEAVHPMVMPLLQLSLDHIDLCSDYERVGRGESFSV